MSPGKVSRLPLSTVLKIVVATSGEATSGMTSATSGEIKVDGKVELSRTDRLRTTRNILKFALF